MTDDDYRPHPALDYQEFVRSTAEWLDTQGYVMLPIEYTIMPHAVVRPKGTVWPVLSLRERRDAIQDKIDVLEAQLFEAKEHRDALDREIDGTT